MAEQLNYKDFLYHLTEGHYQSALILSKELDIDTDIVYKAQWQSRLKEHGFQLNKQDIDLLETIHNDAWVVSQCLQVIINDSLLQKRILEIGLRLSCKYTDTLLQFLMQQYEQDNEQQQQQKEAKEKEWMNLKEDELIWLGSRSYFLQYLDRLQTFLKIWPLLNLSKTQPQQSSVLPNYLDVEGYEQFRDVNLVAQAIEFARTENNQALDALFIHHGDSILPQRLFILEQVPETVDPASFDLPHVTGDHEDLWVQEPWRKKKDSVELPWIQSILKSKLPFAVENTTYLAQLDQNVLTTPYPATAHDIAQWYLHRANTMDSMGLPSHALGLVRYAKAMGVPEMDDYVDRYDWLCKYIYASTSSTTTDFILNLEAFENLSPFDILEGFLLNTTMTTIVSDMKRLVVPWLERYTKKLQMNNDKKKMDVDKNENEDHDDEDHDDDDDELPIFLLYRWLLDISTKQLGWCCKVFEASKPTIDISDRIIKDDCDLSRLVLSMVYSSDGSIEYLVRMFECLPIFNDLEEDNNNEDYVDIASLIPMTATPLGLFTALQSINKKGLTKMMDTLQSHLMSAEVLYRYHASVPLNWYLQDQSVEVQRQLCTRMASQASGGVETGGSQFDTDDDWRELLDDMLRLYDNGNGIFGKLTPNEVMKIFYSSLLRCGQFKLARNLMLGSRPLLEYEEAEKLVIEAEYEFFDNSTSGNMNHGNMKKAMDCLQVLPPTANIKKEMDLIESTHSLISVYQINDKPGIVLMPIQLRQSTNRLDLISKLVNSRKGIYRQFKDIIALTKKLGYQDDVLAEVIVLSMMAGAAMVDQEFTACYRLCQVTIEKAQSITTSKQHNKQYVEQVHQSAWQICFNLGKLDAFEDVLKRMDALAMALTVCPVEYIHDILMVYQQLEEKHPDVVFNQPLAISQLDLTAGSYDDITLENKAGWHGLLEGAKKGQRIIGGLLNTNPTTTNSSMNNHHDHPSVQEHDQTGKRKRDQLRDIVGGVGGWLFQQ
ncbi:unnamed protein product [Cunninghamella blakesleeana]